MNTSHDYILWIATLAYALHVMEEFAFDWKTWAVKVMGFDVDWPLFYVTNGVVMVGGICLSMIAVATLELSIPRDPCWKDRPGSTSTTYLR